MSSIGTDLSNAKNTLSSWDSCMSQAYCKWPVIVAIIVGSLIVLSIVWCIVRCMCFGAECCCGCLSCCRGCCSSGSQNRNQGYQQPLPAGPYSPYGQYQSPMPPMYNPNLGYQVPQTATFDVPNKRSGPTGFNEDSLPAMPSWDNAATRHLEQHDPVEEEESMEMGRLEHTASQQQGLLQDSTAGEQYYAYDDERNNQVRANQGYGQHNNGANANPYDNSPYNTIEGAPYNQSADPRFASTSPVNGYHAASPYHNNNNSSYNNPPAAQYARHFSPSPQGAVSPLSQISASHYAPPARAPSSVYPSTISSISPPPTSANTGYPPSYHTRAPSALSSGGGISRTPVQGSWRNV